MLDKSKSFLIVGLGLIGGSYAMALKKQGFHVSCITRNPDTIAYALKEGIIDEGSVDPEAPFVKEADYVVICLYPGLIADWIKKYQGNFKKGIYITDVSGIKTKIISDVQSVLRSDLEYISAHPMAGRESSGIRFATDQVFKGANYIVVPTEKNTKEAIEWCKDLGVTLGFRNITELTPEKHDKMISYVSQLTHCIAVSLMTANDDDSLYLYTGDSFRDLTRIASINENLWAELFVNNKAALVDSIDMFMGELENFKQAIIKEDFDTLKSKMIQSTEERKKLNKRTEDK